MAECRLQCNFLERKWISVFSHYNSACVKRRRVVDEQLAPSVTVCCVSDYVSGIRQSFYGEELCVVEMIVTLILKMPKRKLKLKSCFTKC